MGAHLPLAPNPVSLRVGLEQRFRPAVVPSDHVGPGTVVAEDPEDLPEEFSETDSLTWTYELVSDFRIHHSLFLRLTSPVHRPPEVVR